MPISAADKPTATASDGSDSEGETMLEDDEEYEEIEVEEEVEEEYEEEVEVEEEEEEEEEEEPEEEEKIEAEEQEEEEEEEEAEEEEEEEEGKEEEEEEGEEEEEVEEIKRESVMEHQLKEVEVEEEEDDDDEEEEEDSGEDLIKEEEHHHRDSQAMESAVMEENQIKPVSTTLQNLPPDTTPAVEHFPEPITTRQVTESSFNEKRKSVASLDAHHDYITPPPMISEPSTSYNKDIPDEEDIRQIGTNAVKDSAQVPPRSDAPLIRRRSFSPGAEKRDSNKRPALICDFFMRGWCIKANSCRFLHVKEGVRDDSIGSQKHVVQVKEGVRDPIERSLSQENGVRSGAHDLRRAISPVKDDYIGKYTSISSVRPLDTHRKGKFEEIDGRFSSSSQVANRHKSSSPYSASSWNLDPLNTHKPTDSEKENFTSNLSSVFLKNISSYSWEPSVPFKSEFLAGKKLSSPNKSYDPIRDSIEPLKYGDGFSKSANKKDASIKDSAVVKPETQGIAERTNKNLLKQEEKISRSKYDKVLIDSESGIQSNRRKIPRSNVEMEVDIGGTDENAYQDSRAFKVFRVSLIEFIKDLVRPAWREGRISKDAHKVIVKKAVEKILSNLAASHVPTTTESTASYFHSSRSKIGKLIQGYIGKYEKYDPAA